MVSDDELSTVGSTNVDFRSFEHNFEVNAFIYDTETALQMRGDILAGPAGMCAGILQELGETSLAP